MKIVKASEMATLEKKAYSRGSSEELFMNNAGEGVAGCVQHLIAKYHLKPDIALLCGKGNNGGDAFVAGTLLLKGGFNVRAMMIAKLEESSPLCKLQAERFLAVGGEIAFIKEGQEIDFGHASLLIDGIYGTGFKGSCKAIETSLIKKANDSSLPILSIDIPSGINGTTGEIGGIAIIATHTLFLGLPKSGCFLGDAWNHVGKCEVFDFGLGSKSLSEAHEEFTLVEESILKTLPEILRNRHKYQAGYVVGIGSSPGMPGALVMAGFSALRSGSGIVRLLHPAAMERELVGAPLELIFQGYKNTKTILEVIERADALFIGPGMGLRLDSAKILKKLLPEIAKPCVIDADALTLIAAERIPFPENAIITPHHGEMKRLLGIRDRVTPQELIQKTQEFSEKNKIIIVLKGAPTFIFQRGQKPYVCPRGDPGMATAGAGDVLTGVLAALLAQKKAPLEAALLGVYLHSTAGELAAEKYSSYSMVATDITLMLPEVIKKFQKSW